MLVCDVQQVPYRSWNRIRNVGDSITPHLIELACGCPSYHSAENERHIIGCGSIMFMANKSSMIWGTGVLGPHVRLPSLEGSQIYALRGKLTANFLRSAGITLPDVPLGDLGIFATEILEKEGWSPGPTRYRAAVIPNHRFLRHPFYQRIASSNEFRLVNVCDDGLLPLKEIASAEVVISQSLHGLIFAEALGKPAVWISAENSVNWNFKYMDWFSTVNNPQREPLSLDCNIDNLIARAERQFSNIDKLSVMRAFPVGSIQTGGPRRLGFRVCREFNPALFFFESPAGDFDFGAGSPEMEAARFLAALEPKIQKMCYEWAERPYIIAILAGKGVVPQPNQFKIILNAMDEMHYLDCVFLVRRSDLDADANSKARVLGCGVVHFESVKCVADTIVLRPMLDGPISNVGVFGI